MRNILFNIACAPETTEERGHAPKRTPSCERSLSQLRAAFVHFAAVKIIFPGAPNSQEFGKSGAAPVFLNLVQLFPKFLRIWEHRGCSGFPKYRGICCKLAGCVAKPCSTAGKGRVVRSVILLLSESR